MRNIDVICRNSLLAVAQAQCLRIKDRVQLEVANSRFLSGSNLQLNLPPCDDFLGQPGPEFWVEGNNVSQVLHINTPTFLGISLSPVESYRIAIEMCLKCLKCFYLLKAGKQSR